MSLEEHLKSNQAGDAFRSLVSQLNSGDLASLDELEARLQPSTNTLKEILELAWEIAKRDGRNLTEVLAVGEVQEALEIKGGRKAKQKGVKDALEVLRYPKLAQIRTELEECVAELSRDCGLRVQLPMDLEGDRLSVAISARNSQEFAEASGKLEGLSSHPKLERIFAILAGNI